MDAAPLFSLWRRCLAHLKRRRSAWTVVAILVVIYAVSAAIWVPRMLRSAALDYVSGTLHRQLTLGEVRFNPLTLTLSAQGVALAEQDGQAIFSAQVLSANLEFWGSLLRGAIDVKEIALQSPRLHARVHRNGQLNLAQLVPASAPDEEPKALPPVRIGRLAVQEGRIDFEDHSHARLFKTAVGPINFALEDFHTEVGHESTYRLVVQLSPQEKITWSGEFSLQPLASHGKFQISHLQVRTLSDWLQDARPNTLPVQPLGGELDLEGHYAVKLDGALSVTADMPTATLRNLVLATRAVDAAPSRPSDTAATEPAPWLRMAELRLSKTRFSLVDRALQIQGLSVQGLQLQVQRDVQGRIEPWQGVQDALRAASQSVPPAEKKPAKPVAVSKGKVAAEQPWRVGVQDFSLVDGQLNFVDTSTQPEVHWSLAPISLSLNDLRSDAPRTAMPVQLSVGAWQGQLTAEGTVQLEPLGAQLKVSASDLDLTALQPYVAQRFSLDLRSALAAAQLQLQYAAASQPRLLLRGDAQVRQLETRDHELGQPLLGWQALQVSGIEFQQGPDRWKLDQIRLRRPYARVAIAANGSLNVSRALRRPGAELPPAAPSASAASAPVPAQIREIVVEDGTADFSDQSLKPTFAAGIYQLQGRVAGLSSEAQTRAQLRLDGSVDRYAPVTIAGDLNLLSAQSYSDLRFRFANMDLTTFNPYSTKYVGYAIDRGKLTTELRYQLKDRRLDAQHHVVLDQLSFGEASDSPDAFSLPVKLATAVLQDSRGVIELDLPVTGSLDDPDFRFGPIVWKALEGLLKRVATAPFALLGSLFDGDEELQFVDFNPGASDLDASQQGKLDKLRRALSERPLLRLDVPLGVVVARDDAAFAQQALEAAVAANTARASAEPIDATTRLAALTSLYTTKTGAAPQWPPELAFRLTDNASDRTAGRITWLTERLAPRYAPTAAEREGLGRARAEAVRRWLIEQGKVAPERIYLITQGARETEGTGSVRMELKLD